MKNDEQVWSLRSLPPPERKRKQKRIPRDNNVQLGNNLTMNEEPIRLNEDEIKVTFNDNHFNEKSLPDFNTSSLKDEKTWDGFSKFNKYTNAEVQTLLNFESERFSACVSSVIKINEGLISIIILFISLSFVNLSLLHWHHLSIS